MAKKSAAQTRNLFDEILKATPVNSKKKASNKELVVLDDAKYPGVSYLLDSVHKKETALKNLQAELEMEKRDLREVLLSEHCELYGEQGRRPDSITFKGKSSEHSYTFVVADNYKKVTNEAYTEITNLFEERVSEVLEEKINFEVNSAMLQKYGHVLSALIKTSKDIEEEDKMKMFVANREYVVRKGTVDIMHTFGKITKNIRRLYDVLGVIVSLKQV